VILALIVGTAGALGAVGRYLVDGYVQDRTKGVLPYGTLVVNVVGSLLMGLVTGIALFHGTTSTLVSIVGTGFCGGFTTWSAFSWESVRLFEERQHRAALLNAAGGLAASLGAAAIGLSLAAL